MALCDQRECSQQETGSAKAEPFEGTSMLSQTGVPERGLLAPSKDRLTQIAFLLQASMASTVGCYLRGDGRLTQSTPLWAGPQAAQPAALVAGWLWESRSACCPAGSQLLLCHVAAGASWKRRTHLGPVQACSNVSVPSLVSLMMCRAELQMMEPPQKAASPGSGCHAPQKPPVAHPAVPCSTTAMYQ